MSNSSQSDPEDYSPGDEADDERIEFGTLAEQKDEAFYDDRSDADDDMEKGRIHFPKHKLYGRDKELQQLQNVYERAFQSEDNGGGGVQVVFLGGVSGAGKTSLIQEFVQRQQGKGKGVAHHLSGKFGQIQAGDPFAALIQAFNQYICHLTEHSTAEQLKPLQNRLAEFEISVDSDTTVCLADTLLPGLYALLRKTTMNAGASQDALSSKTAPKHNLCSATTKDLNNNNTASVMTTSTSRTSMGHDLSAVTMALKHFVKALVATYSDRPLIISIDDLMWGDQASLQVLQGLLSDKSLSRVLFIGAYRKNEVRDDDPFCKFVKAVQQCASERETPEKPQLRESEEEDIQPATEEKESNPSSKEGKKEDTQQTTKPETDEDICKPSDNDSNLSRVTCMEISNLSPDSIGEFIADSIGRTFEEVSPIADAIYTKTLGNIFFVKQALEELVRKNCLFYDVMVFQWQWGDVTRVELEQYLSDDVIGMVMSKLETMPDPLPRALALAAYTKHDIEVDLLLALLKAESIELDRAHIQKLLKRAYTEGLVLQGKRHNHNNSQKNISDSYRFAHDKIREAACASVPEGDERDQFLLRISHVLMERGSVGPNEWMLFCAALHLNSVPVELTNDLDVMHLNLKVAKIAISKGAFTEAGILLNAANRRLDPASCWENHYKLCLDIKNNLMEAEHFLGNEEKAMDVAEEIFSHTHKLPEKTRAQYTYILSVCGRSDNNYDAAIAKGLEILKLYDIDVPENPTNRQVKREKFRLYLTLRGKSLACCSNFPVAKDKTLIGAMQLAQIVSAYAMFAKRFNLTTMLANRMLRLSVSNSVISKNLPYMVVCLGGPLRSKEKYEKASTYANIGLSLMERFPDEKGLDFCKAKTGMYSILSCLRLPFRDVIETLLELNKLLLMKGEPDIGLGSGMLAMYCFYNASLPLNSLLEPKLILFEELATNYGRKTFAVVFSLLRQCLYNLQGGNKSSLNPSELTGEIFKEIEVQAKFDGLPKKMNNRDISAVRLFLAVIFNDEAAMDEMLERLDEYPVHDIPIMRQHFRMMYTGFAAIILSSKNSKCKKYTKWANKCVHFFEKLSKFGSPNAQPVYACMKALRKPSVSSFENAIGLCGCSGLLNLAALMNEHCGLMLTESQSGQGDTWQHEEYLKCALWLYHDWGASAKVMQLQTRFGFLRVAMREKPPSQLSSVRVHTARLGVPNSIRRSKNSIPDMSSLTVA